MLVQGRALRDTISRNTPSSLGVGIDKIETGDVVTINETQTKPDGNWYYVMASGWVNARDIQIEQDIEYDYQLRADNLLESNKTVAPIKGKGMDLQQFSLFGGGGMMPLGGGGFMASKHNPTADVGSIILSRSTGGGCFGNGNSGAFGKSIGGIGVKNGRQMAEAFGFKVRSTSLFGKALGNTSVDSLINGDFGGFLNNLLGNFIDQVFEDMFNRLSFVVGFDVAAFIHDYYSMFEGVDVDDLSLYDGEPNIDGWSAADIAASHYFDYLGCNGEKIIKEVDIYKWEQDAYYSTPTLEYSQQQTEVDFNNQLYEATYDEIEGAINAIKDSVNLNMERTDWFINFNRYRLTHPDYHLHNSRAYVFLTRPDLNIFDMNGTGVNASIKQTQDAAFFYQAVKRHSAISMSLTKMFSGQHDFIPIITNTAKSLDIQDTSLKTLDHGETFTGWKVVYGLNTNESQTAGTITMSFTDDNMLSISYLHYIWVKYINAVSRGYFAPKRDYIRNGILDYASSLYYILTDATGVNLIYWAKYYGLFPTNYPSSAFSFNESSPVKTPDIQIQYAYAFKEDMNPLALAEFNRNSSGNAFSYVPVYNNDTFKCNSTRVGAPFISTEDGGYTYKLRWRSRDA